MGCSKNSSRKMFIAINAYIRNKERSHLNNLTSHLKELEREGKLSQKLAEGRNNKD